MKFALEAISFQGSALFDKLSEMVAYLRVDRRYNTEAIKQTLFTDIIRKYTGMNVELNIHRFGGYNAYTFMPELNEDHVFTKYKGFYARNRSGFSYMDAIDNSPKIGTVDTKEGRVGGLYSQVPCKVVIAVELFESDNFTDGEISAVILHELGHLLSYFEYLNTIGWGGMVATLAAYDIANVTEPSKRMDIIHKAENLLGVDFQDQIYEVEVPEKVGILMFKEYVTSMYNTSGTPIYDARNCEQLADQFAVRHGAAKELASGLYKLESHYWSNSTISKATHVFLEVCKFVAWVVVALVVPFGAVLLLVVAAPQVKIYDDPEQRILMIKRQLIDNLKQCRVKGDTDGIIATTKDIEMVEQVMNEFDDKRTLAHVFWESIPGFYKDARRQEKRAKELEALLFNDLFYQAGRLQTVNMTGVNNV